MFPFWCFPAHSSFKIINTNNVVMLKLYYEDKDDPSRSQLNRVPITIIALHDREQSSTTKPGENNGKKASPCYLLYSYTGKIIVILLRVYMPNDSLYDFMLDRVTQ